MARRDQLKAVRFPMTTGHSIDSPKNIEDADREFTPPVR
jgi:hypothetical protein